MIFCLGDLISLKNVTGQTWTQVYLGGYICFDDFLHAPKDLLVDPSQLSNFLYFVSP